MGLLGSPSPMPPSGRAAVRVAAIVLNFGTPDVALDAVRSVMASTRQVDDLIVVDNGAPPDAATWWHAQRPDVTHVPLSRNLGFSAGMNAGIRLALARRADAVLLVNSDALLAPTCLSALEHTMWSDASCGIVGPILRSREAPVRELSRGLRFSSRTGRMCDRAADGIAVDEPGRSREVVDAVSGCVMLVRREVFDTVGQFDDAYFFGFEDLDLCLRARRAGFASCIDPGAVAFHHGSLSIGAHSPRRLYFAARNHQRMATRAYPAPNRAAALARFASIAVLNVAHAVRAPGGSLGQRLQAVWAGTRDHLDGRYGNGPWATAGDVPAA